MTEGLPSISTLYRLHHARLHNFVRQREPREVDDICAEVWEDVVGYIDRFEGDTEGLEGLLFVIARRRISDHRRKRARRRTDVVDDVMFVDRAGNDRTDRDALDPLHSVAVLEELLRDLTPAQIDVVMLRIVHGLSVDRVAALLSRTPGNVRIIQHRAMKQLRAAS